MHFKQTADSDSVSIYQVSYLDRITLNIKHPATSGGF